MYEDSHLDAYWEDRLSYGSEDVQLEQPDLDNIWCEIEGVPGDLCECEEFDTDDYN